jgi:rRNA maturation endonuclease Nob1
MLDNEIEIAYRCLGCEHVYQGEPVSSCDCGNNSGFEQCFIGSMRLLEQIKKNPEIFNE